MPDEASAMQFIGRVNRMHYWLAIIAVAYFKGRAISIGTTPAAMFYLVMELFTIVLLIARLHDCNMPTFAGFVLISLAFTVPHALQGNERILLSLAFLVVPGLMPGGPDNRWGPANTGLEGFFYRPVRMPSDSRSKPRQPPARPARSVADRRLDAIKSGR